MKLIVAELERNLDSPKSASFATSPPLPSAYMSVAETISTRSRGFTKMPSRTVSSFSSLDSTWSPATTRPKMVYFLSRKGTGPRSIEKLEVPVFGSSNFPIESTPLA